jgi:two-component system, response regulator PdtaR
MTTMATRVLIAEDNWLTPTVLRAELEAHGYQVAGVARTGREALDMCRRDLPDVVLMDIRMPEMDGLEATRVLMEKHSVCVVVVTGDTSLSQAAAEAGAMDYLVKPFLPDEIGAVVARAQQRFGLFQFIRGQSRDLEEALEIWLAVRRAVQSLADHHNLTEEQAFTRLQQDAFTRQVPLRDAARAVPAEEQSRVA